MFAHFDQSLRKYFIHEIFRGTWKFIKIGFYFQINIPLSKIIEVVPGSPPFLIAEGESKCAVGKFHIYLDGRLIPCKDGYTFLEAFDALFMAYYVFNLKYDESLHPFFTFLESFFYKIGDEKKLTPKLRELRSRLTV